MAQSVLLFWLLVMLPGLACLFAGEDGLVKGTVTAPSRAPIPGAKVTLIAADGSRRSVISDENGHYAFPAVDPGTYSLCAEATAYQVSTPTAVLVASGTSTTIDFRLLPGASKGPTQAPGAPAQPAYYDDTPLMASAVTTTIDSAGYSSQAQSPQRLMTEGPSLGGETPRIPVRTTGSPEAVQTERDLQKALHEHPDNFYANHQLGEFYLSVNDFKAGIPYLEKAKTLEAEDYANGYDLAVAYLEDKRPALAQSLLQEMLRRKDAAELHNLLGKADEALSDAVSAIEEYQLAAQIDPNEKNLFDEANELLMHNDIEPAMKVFKRGVALYAGSQRMYIGLGIAYYSRNRYEDAIEALCHASDLNPRDPGPYLFLGKMYNVSAGKSDEVVNHMKRFTETNPDNALAYFYYARSLWKGTRGNDQRGVDLTEVEELLRKSISLDPRLADAHLELGGLLQVLHRDQDALAQLKSAVQLEPDDADAHYRLAQAYIRGGDKVRGQEELQVYDKLHK